MSVPALVLWPISAMLLEISLNFERYHCHFKNEGENISFFVSFNVTPSEVYSQGTLCRCPEISDLSPHGSQHFQSWSMIDQQVGNSPREDRAPDMCTQMTFALNLHARLLLSPVKQPCSHILRVLPPVRTRPVLSSPSPCSSCSVHDPFEDEELRLCNRERSGVTGKHQGS